MATEYRVWCENGDLVGHTTVTRHHGWSTVDFHPFRTDDPMREPCSFRDPEVAAKIARVAAERYMKEAIAYETKERGEVPVGVLSEHGFSIQVCEDD